MHSFDALGEADAEARRIAGELVAGPRRGREQRSLTKLITSALPHWSRMSYVLAFLGFAALIILHEAGHFVAAKAVGMRVERFSLFFGPMLWKVRRGETEYGDRRDPARRLREDHRHEPPGGAPGGGASRARTTTSRCGSGSS